MNEPKRSTDSHSILRRNSSFGSTYRLAVKELKEILRDRRTIITLVGMPLLIYPLLSILFQKFYFSAAAETKQAKYVFVFEEAWQDDDGNTIEPPDKSQQSDAIEPATDSNPKPEESLIDFFIRFNINIGEAYAFPELELPKYVGVRARTEEESDPGFVAATEERYFVDNELRPMGPDENTLEEIVQTGTADLGIRVVRRTGRMPTIEIVQSDFGSSARAAEYLRKRIDATNYVLARRDVNGLRGRLRQLTNRPILPGSVSRYVNKIIEGTSKTPAISMASLVPLILILMTVTGAVYPAIDLTAGERERGTLEALIAAPIPRFQVLFAKFIGVLTVAMMTAVVNMTGMFSTLFVFGLIPILFGEGSFGGWEILQVFGLLILFAGFFSAVLLAVTSFARSFKEAQAYIVPLMLLSITPGVISLTPGLQLSGILSVVPLVNIVLLAREIMEGTATPLPAIIAISSTTVYGLAALSIAASIFGSDSILYGSQTSWRSLIRRPRLKQNTVPISNAMSCLAVIFPLSFLSIGLVSRVPGVVANWQGIEVEKVAYWHNLLPFALSTVIVFVVVPYLFLWHGNVRLKNALKLKFGNGMGYVAAVLIGVCLWPLVGQLVYLVNDWIGFIQGSSSDVPEWKQQLIEKAKAVVEQWRTVNPFLIVFCFSVIPAVCEEFFFRGVLFRALFSQNRAWVAIIVSALAFGIFHTLSLTDLSSQKFLPSFLAGLVLAWLSYKSGSIIPGMILHTVNNGILVSVAYYEDKLASAGWIKENQDGFPSGILWLAFIGVIAGAVITWLMKTPDFQNEQLTTVASAKQSEKE